MTPDIYLLVCTFFYTRLTSLNHVCMVKYTRDAKILLGTIGLKVFNINFAVFLKNSQLLLLYYFSPPSNKEISCNNIAI